MIDRIKDHYSGAKRIALLAHDQLTDTWYHIYSVIELLPFELPPYNIPNKDWFQNKSARAAASKKSDEYSFHVVVTNIGSPQEAIDAFSEPLRLNSFDGKANHFFNKGFTREPSGDAPLIIRPNIRTDDGIGSVLPKRNCGAFVFSQIDDERTVHNLFYNNGISKEMRAMSQLTLDWLGFDLWAKPEHIGNIYLCAPNPYFRDFDVSLSTDPPGLYYAFRMRSGVEETFSIRVIDLHGDDVALDASFALDRKVGLLKLPHEPNHCEVRIYNSYGDLVWMTGPFYFIKSIHIGMSMKQADLNVKLQDADGAKEFTVEKYSKELPSIVGKPTAFNAAHYFKDAESRRKHVINKKNRDFIFFAGAKEENERAKRKLEAKTEIREIINHAKEVCYVCDPYFNVRDLVEYLFYIKSSAVDIRILNCKGSKYVNKQEATLLLNAINEYNLKPFQNIECRMLRGAKSLLHDRFLICDSNVWFLGSSFSEFGDRATCLARVPESNNLEIMKEIDNWFFNKSDNYTQSIQEYVKGEADE